MGERVIFKWRPSRRGGSLGPLGSYEAEAADLALARDAYRAALLFSPDSFERARRINEARFLMDALALLGARTVEGPPVSDAPRPAAARPRYLDEAAVLADAVA